MKPMQLTTKVRRTTASPSDTNILHITSIPSFSYTTKAWYKKAWYEICVKGKYIRLPIPNQSKVHAAKPLELVCTDLCGSVQTSAGERKYLLTLIDELARYCVAYSLKEKSQTINMLEREVEMVTNKFNRRPQILRSDNGGEYISQHMQTYLRQQGIRHEHTVANTPVQNGVVEREK